RADRRSNASLAPSADPRITLALNTGSRSCLRAVPIFDGGSLDAALSAYAAEVLEYAVQLHEDGALVILPRVVEWYQYDFVSSA
ncbi:hypothetical protein T492DRAFT_571873, partial [Pavlovales sp. CCMP2436]